MFRASSTRICRSAIHAENRSTARCNARSWRKRSMFCRRPISRAPPSKCHTHSAVTGHGGSATSKYGPAMQRDSRSLEQNVERSDNGLETRAGYGKTSRPDFHNEVLGKPGSRRDVYRPVNLHGRALTFLCLFLGDNNQNFAIGDLVTLGDPQLTDQS